MEKKAKQEVKERLKAKVAVVEERVNRRQRNLDQGEASRNTAQQNPI